MSVRRPTMRSSASLLAGLLIAATVSSGAIGATTRIDRAGNRRHRRRCPRRRLAGRQEVRRPDQAHPPDRRATGAQQRPAARRAEAHRPAGPQPAGARSPRASTRGAGHGRPEDGARRRAGPGRCDDEQWRSGGPQAGFDGMSQIEPRHQRREPPDPWVAVGPEHVVQTVNLTMNITDRQGADSLSVALADFFLLPTDIPTYNADPHVIYDSLHGRWVATEVSWDCDTVVRRPVRHRLHRLRRLADDRSDRDLEPRLLLLVGPGPARRPGAGNDRPTRSGSPATCTP